ncbi:unnamed protein product [Didymodactylos carnosus]|uniref:Uncharacterized protein n=1 Tax=Didymodactylos carnosus TaxID=1234261 RepID=A0A814SZC1_9BILA|nr:unnamed protein product [Didymodactylos carnosus]CAF1395868.1 unnamed protein product [Didymodactylos carnosus]CAF3918219.1 unnamed protein product [Didymodactylos carnosus]CAF4203306.1 unnamed protein product [Didymodactylos carnosus]
MSLQVFDIDDEIHCIHHQFVRQAILHPQKIAVILEEQAVTYSEVLYHVQILSLYLIQESDVKKGDIIFQCVERSIEMIIGILAIMTTGCVYCPLNPVDSFLSLKVLMDDIHANTGLLHTKTENKFNTTINDNNIHFVNSQEIINNSANKTVISDENLHELSSVDVTIEDTAYIICTSGSTGKPKAIQSLHRNIAVYSKLLDQQNIYNQPATIIQIAGCSWILHSYEIFSALSSGATLIMLKPDGNRDINYLTEVIETKQVTSMWVSPSTMRILCAFLQTTNQGHRLKTIRNFCTAGEIMKRKLVSLLASHLSADARIYNIYGSSECGNITAYLINNPHEINSSTVMPIGRPLSSYQCYILNDEMQPANLDQIGEVYIGGPGVFKGYVCPILTEKALINIPGVKEKCFRTGDLAKYNSNGEIIYVSRTDFQIKIHSQYIETGEIENVILASCNDISDCIVVKVSNEKSEQDCVAAYIELSSLQLERDNLSLESHIQEYCRSRLPLHMIPSSFIILNKLPLNSNGKVDRKQLPVNK